MNKYSAKSMQVITKPFLMPFILVGLLFPLWGFANDITNPLVAAFKNILLIYRKNQKLICIEKRGINIIWNKIKFLKSFKKFALKIMKYRKHIEAYIKSNLTTAVSEGLNNKIKVFKRAGYNYTNEDSFKNKILQRCGFLNSTYINTNFLYWHVPTPQNWPQNRLYRLWGWICGLAI